VSPAIFAGMKTKFHVAIGLAGVVILGASALGAWRYLRPSDRITLDVRNMEVREVARKIERQTGRTIVVQSNVVGKVTLKAKDLPFEKALEIVGEQASARVGSLYPLYSSSKSLDRLIAILAGNSARRVGWTNLAVRFGGPGPRRDEMEKANKVSLNINFEDLTFAAMAFSRLTPARMVVEDGAASKRISVNLANAPVREAVALVAKKANEDWTEIFLLSGGGQGFGRGPAPEGAARRRADAVEVTDEERAEREVLNDHLLATLPEEEREKREEAAAERQKRMEEFQNMTAEQRMQAMQTMRQNQQQGGSQRMLERIKNSTPEQRAAQRRQMAQRRADASRMPPVTRN
jgi:hypothetical protein